MIGTDPNLLIIGASTRAAAFSALRAELRPLCLDMFADQDLLAHVPVKKIENYPHGLISALQALPRMPLLYVGGLENQPEILQIAQEHHELLGNSADVVAAVRNPEVLAPALRMAQVSMPDWCPADSPPDADGSWILRPLFGSGGRGIQTWDAQAATSPVLHEPHIFQKRIAGTSFSGVFIAFEDVGDVRFVGVTEQLIGDGIQHAAPYQWFGNIGPTTLSIPVEHKMRRVGNVLRFKAGVRGLFGVDFIVTEDEQVFVTEVNPRYPASLELLEFSTGQALLEAHLRCFTGSQSASSWTPAATEPLIAKAILYAPQNFQLTIDLTPEIGDWAAVPSLADVPPPGTQFLTGQPVCTVFATGATLQECRQKLFDQLSKLQTRLCNQ